MAWENEPYVWAKTPGGAVVPLPYDNRLPEMPARSVLFCNISQEPEDPAVPAEIVYRKRSGGVYLYSNNPEKLRNEDKNRSILKYRDLSGDAEFTFEHSNHSDAPLYFGFRLTNMGRKNAEVLVTNVGFQTDGEWLGQRSWSDFYNVKFTLPKYYFDRNGEETFPYGGQDFLDYTPRVFLPTVYQIPPGRFMYILGGTSADAYRRTDVAGTANRPVYPGRCANGAVKFRVTKGEVTADFLVYEHPQAVQGDLPEQGYIVRRGGVDFGAQYKGADSSLGLIEAQIGWTVGDKTPKGPLAVSYVSAYDEHIGPEPGEPYACYASTPHRLERREWLTALNPQNDHNAVGTDMMVFRGIRADGTPLIIDNEHADGEGRPANTGNWMVQYHNNYTFINRGQTDRTFRIYADGALSGALFVLVRNKKGDILDARCTISAICVPADRLQENDFDRYEVYEGMAYPIMPDGRSYRQYKQDQALMATLKVRARSVRQMTLDYNILGNSCGGVRNWVTVE